MIDISVSNLVKEFEVGHKILDGLTFQVDTGERVGLLGPNGCGKTTLLRILTGVLDYDEGDVVIAPGKRMGLISQIPVYPAGYTVEDGRGATPPSCQGTTGSPPPMRPPGAMRRTPAPTRCATACPSPSPCGSSSLTSSPAGRRPG